MAKTITIALTDTEMKLLLKHAALDCRRPQEQARYILRSMLLGESPTPDAHQEKTSSAKIEPVYAAGVTNHP